MVMRATRNFGEKPEATRPPAAHIRRSALATPIGKAPTKHMQDCETCADRDICLRAVIRLGMFARLECEMAAGEVNPASTRKPRNVHLSQDILHICEEAGRPLTTAQIARAVGGHNRSIWRALQRLEEDGHITHTTRRQHALNAKETVWQLAQEV